MTRSIFREGFVPLVENMPAEKTHARAKLIYNLLRVMIFFKPHKQAVALKELQRANHVLHDRIKKYLAELSPKEIQFFKGPRPTHHADGTLAIYDLKGADNPLLVRVVAGEEPEDASRLWTPEKGIGHELTELRNAGRIVVGGH